MSGQSIKISSLLRKYNFPYKVENIYYCWRWIRPVDYLQIIDEDCLEISIRLDCTADICLDIVNDKPCNVKFPHVLIKRPGDRIISTQYEKRDTIAFQYHVSLMSELEKIGLLPQKTVWEFKMTPRIEELITQFRKYLYRVYAPGVPDEIDWVCFKLLRELSHQEQVAETDEKITMQNASVWMKVHYNEKLAAEEIAAQYNMSRATFYRAWRRHFNESPIQYLLNLRLEAAAEMLRETPLSIARIADEVGFCGVDAFHRKFKIKYGVTPGQYRAENNDPDQA
ncbi:MAG: helix-turn-helix transcriptional regulator [Lentisphaerae bacterium]|nr:helix-turn-helix transcriptional regulator [Lentisphaerota bacterium]